MLAACARARGDPLLSTEFCWKFIKTVVRYMAAAGGVVSEGKIPDLKLSPKGAHCIDDKACCCKEYV